MCPADRMSWTLEFMSTRPRVLFLAPVEPWCRENGSSLVISDLLEGLAGAEGAEVLVLFLRRPPADCTPRWPKDLNGLTIGARGLPRWLSVSTALLRNTSPLRTRFANTSVTRRLLQVLRDRSFTPDVIHAEHLPLIDIGRRLASVFDCPLAYRAHNIESRLWERRFGLGGLARRWVVSRMEHFEEEAIRSSQLTLGISDVDLDWMRTRAPSARVDLLPCTLLFSRYESLIAETAVPEAQICFVGGLDWRPNENGLHWFVHEVVPRIVEKSPQAKVAVLARGAEQRPWLAENPHIRLVASNTQAAALFARSRVSVAPLLQGGGVRVKILESLAVGCPVVATRIGGEGLDLPGVTHTDDPDEFAETCTEHLRSVPSREARQRRVEAVRLRHDAQVWAEKLIEWWSGLAQYDAAPAFTPT